VEGSAASGKGWRQAARSAAKEELVIDSQEKRQPWLPFSRCAPNRAHVGLRRCDQLARWTLPYF
jgi:hypothetical protein